MREIKFRAWDIKRKEFNYLDLRDAIGSDNAYSLCGSQGTDWEVDRKNSCTMSCKCELQQFTGLKDKNGKEIYEGDIVSYIGYSAYGRDNKKSITEIKWEEGDGGFSLNWLTEIDNGDIGLGCIEIEVIGNIYENPELLHSS